MFTLSLEYTNLIVNTAIFALGYGIATIAVGYLAAHLAYLLGDTTPYQYDFNTLNPLVHIDPIGALLIIFTGVGWMRQIPIDTEHIHGTCARLRKFLLNSITTISALLISTACFMVIKIMVGPASAMLIQSTIMYSDPFLSLEYLNAVLSQTSSTKLLLIYILIVTIYVSILGSLFSIVGNTYRYLAGTSPYLEEYSEEESSSDFYNFIVPLLISFLLISLFSGIFIRLMLAFIFLMGNSVFAILGMIKL